MAAVQKTFTAALSHPFRQHGAIPAQMREQLGALERVVQSLLEQALFFVLVVGSSALEPRLSSTPSPNSGLSPQGRLDSCPLL